MMWFMFLFFVFCKKNVPVHRRARACPSLCCDREAKSVPCHRRARACPSPASDREAKSVPVHRRARACPSPCCDLDDDSVVQERLLLIRFGSRRSRTTERGPMSPPLCRSGSPDPDLFVIRRSQTTEWGESRPGGLSYRRRSRGTGPRATVKKNACLTIARDRPSRYWKKRHLSRDRTIARDRPSRYGTGTGNHDREGQALALRDRNGMPSRDRTIARDRPSRYGTGEVSPTATF